MIVNALLVRWSGGWAEITDAAAIAAHGRQEGLLALGAVQSYDEMASIAEHQLTVFADPRMEIAADLAPVETADTPYAGFGVGDSVTVNVSGTPMVERVRAITVSQDDNGVVTYAPELRDVLLDQRERFADTLAKMSSGTLGGASKVATPLSALTDFAAAPVRGITVAQASAEPVPFAAWDAYHTQARVATNAHRAMPLLYWQHTDNVERNVEIGPQGQDPGGVIPWVGGTYVFTVNASNYASPDDLVQVQLSYDRGSRSAIGKGGASLTVVAEVSASIPVKPFVVAWSDTLTEVELVTQFAGVLISPQYGW